MRKLNSVLLMVLGILAFYQYRYRLMNVVLSRPNIRHFFIQLSMRIPFIREKFMFRAFH
ncbi:hypothetical protein [Metabacillus idriensis]|uniref:hypothetical protein n=1 Tax=Metabacillus idriensis TaxID=324768 RepID=UPI003D27DBA5